MKTNLKLKLLRQKSLLRDEQTGEVIKCPLGTMEKRKEFLKEMKSGKGCKICGEKRAWVLLQHHIDPKEKILTLSDSQYYPDEVFYNECKKCVIICRNCHRDIHYWFSRKDFQDFLQVINAIIKGIKYD